MHLDVSRTVAEVGDKMRVLDMTRGDVREATAKAVSASELYMGKLAGDYA